MVTMLPTKVIFKGPSKPMPDPQKKWGDDMSQSCWSGAGCPGDHFQIE